MSESEENIISGRYRLIEQVSSTMYETVIVAEDIADDNRKVFLKFLPRQILARRSYYDALCNEISDAEELSHPNIENVLRFDDSDYPFVVSDYFKGETLEALIDSDWHPTSDDLCRWLFPIAEAIDYAHEKGYVHGDLRPSAILIDEEAKPIVTDFGMAAQIRNCFSTSCSGTYSGSRSYLSPEYLIGMAPSRSQDIYSFAAIAYECLCGHPPFYRGQIDYQIINTKAPPLKENTPFARAIMKALSKDAFLRPKTCREILILSKHSMRVASAKPAEKTPPTPAEASPNLEDPSIPPVAKVPTLAIGSTEADKPKAQVSRESLPQMTAAEKAVGGSLRSRQASHGGARRRVYNDRDESSPDFLFRLRTEPIYQALALGVTLALIIAGTVFCMIKDDGKITPAATVSSQAANADYSQFEGIALDKEFESYPVLGEDMGYGIVTTVGLGNKSFDVKFKKKLFNFFDTARISTVNVGPDGKGGRVSLIDIVKESKDTTPADRARLAVNALAMYVGKSFNITLPEVMSDPSDTYFNVSYSDDDIRIHISCALAEASTTFAVRIYNLTANQ